MTPNHSHLRNLTRSCLVHAALAASTSFWPSIRKSAMTPIDTSVAVVIVGAGPTGLAAANLLGQAGIATLVFERHPGLSEYPKAITIDDDGLRICQAMGLIDDILAHVLLDIDAHY